MVIDKDKKKEYDKNYYQENKKQRKKYYKNHKVKIAKYQHKNKDKISIQDHKRYLERRIWFNNYKNTLKCYTCEENHRACIEFHHRDPSKKKYNIAEMVIWGISKEKILKEIKKCDILCANCHKKLHHIS